LPRFTTTLITISNPLLLPMATTISGTMDMQLIGLLLLLLLHQVGVRVAVVLSVDLGWVAQTFTLIPTLLLLRTRLLP
jgi:hypothetical protein